MSFNLISVLSEQHLPDVTEKILPIIFCKCAQAEQISALTVFIDENNPQAVQLVMQNVTERTVILTDSGTFSGLHELLIQLASRSGAEVVRQPYGFLCKGKSSVLIIDLNIKNIGRALRVKNFAEAFNYNKTATILKTFGIGENQVKDYLAEQCLNGPVSFTTYSHNFECLVALHVLDAGAKQAEENILRQFYQKFAEHIYTETEQSVYEAVEGLLELRKVKLSVADSLTHGLFLNELKTGFKKFESTVAAFEQIIRKPDFFTKLKITESQAKSLEGSIELAYEMAANLLNDHPGTMVVVLCGTPEKPFIAAGDSSGIHVYKFNLQAGELFIAKLLARNAIFKLIKKLKQNDLYFYDSGI